MAERINYKRPKIEIDFGGGVVLALPIRTKQIDEEMKQISKNNLDEYEYYTSVLKCLFGEEGLNQILKDGEDTDLDYLMTCSVICQNKFYSAKIDCQKAELKKQSDMIAPISDKVKPIGKFIK